MNVSFAEDMRTIDESVVKDYGLPAAALMENAGRRTAEEAAALIGSAADKVFAVFAGGGNNGGEAFALLTQWWTAFSARGCRESCASRSCG